MTQAQASTAVVITIDERYALPAACLIATLAETSSTSVERIIIGACDLSEPTADILRELATRHGLPLEVHDVSYELRQERDLPVGQLTLASWARLLIPDLCKDVDRYLYLDADTICLDDIGPLLRVDLEGRVVGAVQDVFQPTLGSPICLPHIAFNQEERRQPYFNAGVLAVDAVAWRAAEITKRTFAFVHEHPESIRFGDQDALNAVLIGRWHQLDRTWNVPPIRDVLDTLRFGYFGRKFLKPADFARLEATAKVVHYLTELKPWLPDFPSGLQLSRYRAAVRQVDREIETLLVSSLDPATRQAWTTFQGLRTPPSSRSG